MSLSFSSVLPSRAAALDNGPTTMPLPPGEPLAWRRWADAMPDVCLWLAPESGRIVDCNRALFALLGYSRGEVFGWPVKALAEPRNLESASAVWRSLSACRELRDADCTLRARNGFEVAVSVTANPVLNDEGKLVAGLVVLRDITERRRREQSVLARKRQLKSLAFELAGAESRQRQRIARRLQDDAGQALAQAHARLLQLIAESDGGSMASRLAEVEGLLGSAMRGLDAAEADLNPPLLRAQGLQAAIEGLSHQISRETALVSRVEGELPELEMPETTLAVVFGVLRELAGNATRHANARHLWFRIQTDPDRLCIVVGDDGRGFDVARLSVASAPDEGFGLFTAEAQMQAVGGRLVVQSKPGRGTRAMLVLPLTAAMQPAPETR